MSGSGPVEDEPYRDGAHRRRETLERAWQQFESAAGDKVSLSDELIAERRLEAAVEDDSIGNLSSSTPLPYWRCCTEKPAGTS
jgi:hypothetical protein